MRTIPKRYGGSAMAKSRTNKAAALRRRRQEIENELDLELELPFPASDALQIILSAGAEKTAPPASDETRKARR
jgi:hypothetical protein